MIINHNISAMNSARILSKTNFNIQKNLEKLSSGYRINRAGDDAAGLAISEKMRGQVSGMNQAVRNAQDGISLIQTSEAALEEVQNMVQRMRTLAIQAANDTNVSSDRSQMQTELIELASEINRIASTTEFNTRPLLGGFGALFSGIIHIGANSGQNMKITINNMTSSFLGVSVTNYGVPDYAGFATGQDPSKPGMQAFSVMTQSDADIAISSLDNALASVSTQRAKLGAWQNRLEHTISNLSVGEENLQAAESRIRDTDVAHETMQFSKNQILLQSGTSMLAQAKQRTQAALSLLG